MQVLSRFPSSFLFFSVSFFHIKLEEEESEDKFDLNISVRNPEKVGKIVLCSFFRLLRINTVLIKHLFKIAFEASSGLRLQKTRNCYYLMR